MSDYEILPLGERHFAQLHHVFDRVCKETGFMAFTKAPPREETFAFYQQSVNAGWPHFVCLCAGEVVGWCDALPLSRDTQKHAAVLGIGLLPQARNQGLGRRLMITTMHAAWAQGFTRIELSVRAGNTPAYRLYTQMGFELEGIKRQAWCIEGRYFDVHDMAVLRTDVTRPLAPS